MPIYEYECSQCGRIEEALQKFSDKPLKTCRHCRGKLNKLVSQSSFLLKGTGWYVTDYADRSKKPASTPDKKDSTPSASSEKKASSKGSDNAGKTTKKAAD